ncbi:MAG: T9SS type A sorting domain-containing protein [Candidatus Kapaibacterium sp.]
MKYFIILLLVLVAGSSMAQIKLETNYEGISNDFGLVEVDSGIHKYIRTNEIDSIFIFNLDHSLDRVIAFHLDTASAVHVAYISKRLFDPDDQYEFLLWYYHLQKLAVLKEDGSILFSCNDCSVPNYWIQSATNDCSSIINTENGVKMLVQYNNPPNPYIGVFSLPGKLPGGNGAKSSVDPPPIVSGNPLPTSAYPNPSNGQMRISYKLPLGESTGELVILTANGVEVKRYKVGDGFNDILVEKSDLSSGSYFYKLVTAKGESEVKRLVILK